MSTDIITRATLQELCAHRLAALDKYKLGIENLIEAQRLHAEAAPGTQVHALDDSMLRMFKYSENYSEKHVTDFLTEIKKGIDQDMWRSLITSTRLFSLMDTEEKKHFETDLKTNPPEVTPDTVMATLDRLSADAGSIFRRGLVNAFTSLCRDYKSHDGFKIGDRLVIGYAVQFYKWGSFSSSYNSTSDRLQDVDRVMHVLDGKPEPDYQNGLCAALRTALGDWKQTQSTEFSTPYWQCRFFKNGNIHLWPTRQDLVDKANKHIAEYFGPTIGSDKGERNTMEGFRPKDADNLGDFPSPSAVVDRILEAAEIEPGMSVIEPSAGSGRIAIPAAQLGASVSVCEIQKDHINQLYAVELFQHVYHGDFLDYPATPRFRRAVGNPPFAGGADIAHAYHAFKFLVSGGRLVFVMSAGIKTRQDRLGQDFRSFLNLYKARVEDLPEGSFLESGTRVNTVLVTIDKP